MHITIEANVSNIERVTEFVNDALDALGCSRRSRTQIDIALDELFANIALYAYGKGTGMATVRVRKAPKPGFVNVILEDKGMPFDPLKQEEPDVTLSLSERAIGGLGIFMVRKTMDDVAYEYRDGTNIVTITKAL